MINQENIKIYDNDLPDDVYFENSIAIDTETMGLNYKRDRLCLVQISAGDGVCHIVRFKNNEYNCPNLKKLLTDSKVLKILQYARYDMAMVKEKLDIMMAPIYCTKIASKIARTNATQHGLATLCYDLLGIKISKEETSSDWADDTLSTAQLQYAAMDVLYLHQIKTKLDTMIARENRQHLLQGCLDFLPTRAELDRVGWLGIDVMAHSN